MSKQAKLKKTNLREQLYAGTQMKNSVSLPKVNPIGNLEDITTASKLFTLCIHSS